MTKWTIYDRKGKALHESITEFNGDGKIVYQDSLEYSGKWMGERFLTVSIKSAYPIDFQIGDYIEYRGEKFTINYDPTVIKKARRGTYGEGFTYDSIKFNSPSNELTQMRFHDWVLSDNKLHYTSLPTFTFYAKDVDDLVDRLQACADRWCKDNGYAKEDYWMFYTLRNNTVTGTADPRQTQTTYQRTLSRAKDVLESCGISETGSEGKTYLADVQSKWEKMYGIGDNYTDSRDDERYDRNISVSNQSVWDGMSMIKQQFGLNFIVRGRNVYIGAAGIPTTHLLKYGKGNGLYEVDRTADQDQAVVTKLHAYGSGDNLPTRYYADLNKMAGCKVKEVIAAEPDGDNPSASFSTDLPFNEKYFSNKGNGASRGNVYFVTVKISDNPVKGIVWDQDGVMCFSTDVNYDTKANVSTFAAQVMKDAIVYFVDGMNKSTFSASSFYYNPQNLPDNMAVNFLMLPGFPNYSLADICRAEYDKANDVTNYYITNPNTKTETLFHTESGNHVIKFSSDKYDPYIVSPNADTLGIKDFDISCTEENDDNGLEKVYPTIEEITDATAGIGSTGNRLDEIYKADKIDDNGVFPKSTTQEEKIPGFHVWLPNLGFDLRQAAKDAGGSEIQISMKDGFCGGRTFSVANVSQEKDGTWNLNCKRVQDTDLDLYFPYSYAKSVSGVDDSMTNAYQICKGDHYVLTGISVSDVNYVWAASVKLLRKAIHWLCKNDYTRYVYQPKIDEIYMAREAVVAEKLGNTSLHDALMEGDILLFSDDDLKIDGKVYIDQLNIKENGNNGIPTYEVTLRNEVQVGSLQRLQNQVDSIATDVKKGNVGGGLTSPSQVASLIEAYGEEWFLHKDREDTAKKIISFLEGTQIGKSFVSGLLGEGGIFRTDADGKTYLETDKLYVRMKAYFDTVEFRRVQNSGGNRVASPAGGKIIRVEYIDSNGNITTDNASAVKYRCYFRGSDGDSNEVKNEFAIDDLVYCHITNLRNGSLVQQHYWRRVVGRNTEGTLTDNGEYWIDLSVSDCEEGSGIPAPQDSVSTIGNKTDTTRQGAIIEYSTGEDSPSYKIYQGINDYSLKDKNYIDLGYSSASGHAYLNVYGDAYIGDRNGSSYIKYNSKTKKLDIKAKIDLQSTFGDDKTTLKDYIDNNSSDWSEEQINELINTATGDKFNSIDDSIAEIKKQADGAIETWYYKGKPTLNNAPAKDWTTNEIKDTHIGDLYYDQDTGFAYRFLKDDKGTYEWQLIQDSSIAAALKAGQDAQKTADGKRRVFVGTPKPPYDEGDLWVNATYSNGKVSYNNDILRCSTSRQSGNMVISDWGLASKYTDDTALDQFKLNDYVQKLTNGTISNDITNAQTSATNALTNAATAQTSADNAQSAANAADKKGQKGIDDAAAAQTTANTALSDAASAAAVARKAQEQADKGVALATALDAIKQALNNGTTVDGGLVLSTLIGLRDSKNKLWSGISGAYNADAKGGGIAAWYGGAMVDHEAAPTVSDYAKSLFRFDGSGYIANGNITWDEDGKIRIENFYFGNTEITSQNIAKLSELFSYSTNTDANKTIATITPNAPFTELYIGSKGVANDKVLTLGDIANRTWWGQKADANGNVSGAAYGLTEIMNEGAVSYNHAVIWGKTGRNKVDFHEYGGLWNFYQNKDGKNDGSDNVLIGRISSNAYFSGNLGIGTTSPSYKLDVQGTIRTTQTLTIGGITLSYDSQNKALKVDGNLYATGGVSALGMSSVSSSGGGGATSLSGLVDTLISSPANNQVLSYDSSQNKWVNKTIVTDGISSVTVTGNGNAVTDVAKNGTGLTVTKGATFLTQHQSLADYALKSSIPTKVSQLTNDSGYVTSSVVNGYATQSWVKANYLGINANAVSATKLQTSRKINLIHDTTGTVSFDGSTDVSLSTTTNALTNTGGRIASANILYGDGKLRYLIASSLMTEGKPNVDAQILHLAWANKGGWESQLAINHEKNPYMQLRSMNNGTWGDWRTVAFLNDNVASATKLRTPRTISLSGDASGSVSFDGSANVTINATVNNATKWNGVTDNHSTRNTADTWVPVYNNATVEHRVIPTDYNNPPSSLTVGAATKLQTPRTLWGQSFDGTANVSGDMTGVGNLTSSGNASFGGTGYFAQRLTAAAGLAVTGDITTNGKLTSSFASNRWINGASNAIVNGTYTYYGAMLSMPTKDGRASLSSYPDQDNNIYLLWHSQEDINNKNNNNNNNIYWDGKDNVLRVYKLATRSTVQIMSSTLNYNSANAALYCDTNFYSQKGISALQTSTSSDARLKNIIGNVDLSLDAIANAPSVRFSWKNGYGMAVGTIAQYWQKVLPEVVGHNGNYLTLQYGVTALLATISIAKKVEEHEKAINELKAEMERIRK